MDAKPLSAHEMLMKWREWGEGVTSGPQHAAFREVYQALREASGVIAALEQEREKYATESQRQYDRATALEAQVRRLKESMSDTCPNCAWPQDRAQQTIAALREERIALERALRFATCRCEGAPFADTSKHDDECPYAAILRNAANKTEGGT